MAPGLVPVPVLHRVHSVPLVLAPIGQHGLLLCLVKWSHLLYIMAPPGPRELRCLGPKPPNLTVWAQGMLVLEKPTIG